MMKGECLRFYVDENRRHRGVLLWEWLLEQANAMGIRGSSAFRAIGGFGVGDKFLPCREPVAVNILIGEEVGVFITPKPGAGIGPEDVRDFCRGKIAWHKVPRYVAIVEEFPLTASGKIQKYKLREAAAELFPEAMR